MFVVCTYLIYSGRKSDGLNYFISRVTDGKHIECGMFVAIKDIIGQSNR